ncbi:MAG: helix-turn-helix domain-containing protein [Stackebrandtia sp.]
MASFVRIGARLRHWRTTRGLTQRELGRLLGYDATYLSKIENDARPAPPDLPKRCDEVLETGGELAALSAQSSRGRDGGPQRRGHDAGSADDAAAVFDSLLEEHARTARLLGGVSVVRAVEEQIPVIVGWAGEAPEATARRLLGVASRYADLAGWLRHDCGDPRSAGVWFRRAHWWAESSGDAELASCCLADSSCLAWREGDAVAAVDYARAAQRVGAGQPLALARGLLAEARGLGLAGEAHAAALRLDRAERALASGDAADSQTPSPQLAENILRYTSGLCHRDLAARGCRTSARRAVDELRAAARTFPFDNRLDETILELRLAEAYACAGELDAAVATIEVAYPAASVMRSYRIRRELRRARGRLGEQWESAPQLRRLDELIQAAART